MFSLAGATILRISFGYTLKEERDELVDVVNEAVHGFVVSTTPGAFLVDAIPACELRCFVGRI